MMSIMDNAVYEFKCKCCGKVTDTRYYSNCYYKEEYANCIIKQRKSIGIEK